MVNVIKTFVLVVGDNCTLTDDEDAAAVAAADDDNYCHI